MFRCVRVRLHVTKYKRQGNVANMFLPNFETAQEEGRHNFRLFLHFDLSWCWIYCESVKPRVCCPQGPSARFFLEKDLIDLHTHVATYAIKSGR